MNTTQDYRQRYCIILEPHQEGVREALSSFLAKDGEFEIVTQIADEIQGVATIQSGCVDLVSSKGRIPIGHSYSIRFGDGRAVPRVERVMIELIHEERE